MILDLIRNHVTCGEEQVPGIHSLLVQIWVEERNSLQIFKYGEQNPSFLWAQGPVQSSRCTITGLRSNPESRLCWQGLLLHPGRQLHNSVQPGVMLFGVNQKVLIRRFTEKRSERRVWCHYTSNSIAQPSVRLQINARIQNYHQDES